VKKTVRVEVWGIPVPDSSQPMFEIAEPYVQPVVTSLILPASSNRGTDGTEERLVALCSLAQVGAGGLTSRQQPTRGSSAEAPDHRRRRKRDRRDRDDR
jgi:hypothetical protein